MSERDAPFGTDLPQVDLPGVVSLGELEVCKRMAYRVAHDMGNIAAAIIGNAELIRRGIDETQPTFRRAGNIVRSMQLGQKLASHMELFLGQSSRDDQPVDFLGLVQPEVLDVLLRKLSFSVPLVPPAASSTAGTRAPPMPYVSRERIQHALLALLANAADALLDRPGKARVEAGLVMLDEAALAPLLAAPQTRPGEYVFMAVSDEGEGIAPEVLPHLFSPAFSTRMRQEGFGLSDTYGIICGQHGGAIGLWTEPERGTRVVLYVAADRPCPAFL